MTTLRQRGERRDTGGNVSGIDMESDDAMASTDTGLQNMLDEFHLRTLVHAYCRAVDRGDLAQLRNLYHHDAVDTHGGFSAGSADDFLNQLAVSRPYIRSMLHHITAVNFAVSGYTSEGEIYTIATHTVVTGDGEVDVVVGGRYLDKYEKRNGAWKFVDRAIVTDCAYVNDPSTLDLSHSITRDTPRGALDANDPSYRFFSLLNSQQT
ncbi:nuclear transport factor 2 family protein [Mycobacterium sp. URHB0021]